MRFSFRGIGFFRLRPVDVDLVMVIIFARWPAFNDISALELDWLNVMVYAFASPPNLTESLSRSSFP